MFAPETAGAQEKALLKRPGSSRPGMRTVPGGTGRPQAQCGGRLPPPAAGRAGAAPAPGASGPAAIPGLRSGALGRTPQAWGGGGAGPSGGSSDDIPGLPGGFRAGQSAPSEALRLVGLFQEDLTQNDPHWGVRLDGEAQCFQRAKGRVHLALCHTLVEGAYLEVAIGAPRVPEGG